MAETSKIQWTDATWNIARGCTKVDEDCKYCYMYRDSMSNTRYNPLEIVRTKTVFNMPLKLKQPSKIFTSSLTDVFHPAIDSYRHEMWEIIIGGESGHEHGKYQYRPCKLEWIELLINHCNEAKVPVFVKQLGTHLAKELKLKDRHGGDISEWPQHLKIRQFPINSLTNHHINSSN